jgi:hypothetical protein
LWKRPAPACLHSGCNNRRTNNFLMLAGLLSRTKAWAGQADGQPCSLWWCQGDYSVSKVSSELVLRNWCFGWGVSRYPELIRRQQLPSYNLQKRFFVCLFVCFICLLCGVEISQILGPLGLCFLFLRTARKKAFLVSEYLVEGFIEVVFLSFKTCHVREAFFFFFLWQFFCNFVGNILEDTKFSYFFLKKICHEMNFLLLKSCKKVATIAYKMKMCLRFFTFTF